MNTKEADNSVDLLGRDIISSVLEGSNRRYTLCDTNKLKIINIKTLKSLVNV